MFGNNNQTAPMNPHLNMPMPQQQPQINSNQYNAEELLYLLKHM
jgi:hypothetical protein